MSHFKKRLLLFKNPAFSWYVLACVLATMGGGFSYVALTWTVVSMHSSVFSVAMLMICFWLPGVLLAPFIGVLVDRVARKSLLAWSNLMRAMTLFVMGFLILHFNSLIMLYIFGLILGTFFSIYLPAAFTFVREIVAEDQLLVGNATIDMAYEMGNVIGMGSAGVVIAITSISWAYIINSLYLLIAAILMFCIAKHHIASIQSEKKRVKDFFEDVSAGFRYVRDNRNLCLIYVIQLLIAVQFMTTPILLAPFAKQILHLGVKQFGHVEAALSIGVVIGGMLFPWFAERLNLVKTLIVAVAICGLCFVAFGYNRNFTMAEILYFMIGLALACWPMILTKAQEMTEMEFQGRVMATFNSLMGISILLMYGFVSMGSRYISVSHLYWSQMVISVLAIFLLFRFRRQMN